MVGGEPERLRGGASRSSRRSARPSCTSARPAPARPSRPPTSSSWPATSSCSPRRSCSSRPTASTRRPRSQVLGGGLAGSTVLDRKGASMLARNFKPGFRIDLHHKDMGIVSRAAREAGRRDPARRGGRPAGRRAGRPRRRRPRPLRPAQARRRAVGQTAVRQPDFRHERGVADMATMTAADAAVAILELEGATQRVRPARRGDQPVLRRDAPQHGGDRIATCSPATSRAPRTWPRATPGPAPATSASASAPPAPPAPT